MHDIRYAIRALRKQPLFTLVAVLTLALGIGANTAIFSLLYQVLLRPLPYPDADRLVFVWNTYPLMGLPQASVSIPDYIDRKTQASAIEDATLFTGGSANLADGGQPEQVRSLMVTPSFFTTLQRQPFLGRGFTEDEARPEADNFVILSYGLWQSRFGGDRSLVGSLGLEAAVSIAGQDQSRHLIIAGQRRSQFCLLQRLAVLALGEQRSQQRQLDD